MVVVEGWLLDADYITENGKAVIRLWCKDEKGIFVAYDRSFQPYFYAIKEEGVTAEDIMNLKIQKRKEVISPERVEETTAKNLGREVEVFKIYAKHPQHVPKLREAVGELLEVREADIPFAYRYLIDKDLACMDGITIECVERTGSFRSYEVKNVKRNPKDDFPELKILAFDCEMLSAVGMPDPEKDPIIVISVKSGDFEDIINGDDEREVLKRFVKAVKDIDPDVIVGYNQDSFDWPYIKKRAEKLSVRLDIGRDRSELAMRGGRPKIAGRLNVDLYDIAMRSIDVKIKKLENVAEFLGTKVELADIEAKDIYKHWTRGDREAVLRYARQDVLNTYFIAEELLPMHYELSRMIRIPLDDVTRCGRGKQVEWLLMSEAYKLGELAPNPREAGEKYEGAFVLEPARGLHENVICLDFASMYPSIMISFNISPDTLVIGKCDDCNVAPEVGHKFRREPDGFFKRILRMLIEKRREIKKIMKKLDRESNEYRLLDIKQATLKVLTNSFYGYTGWSLARWYCRECAEATTAWGRHFIKKSAQIAKELGLEVLYGDTDSIFVKKSGLNLEELKKEVRKLIGKLREEMPILIEIDEYYSAIFFVEKKRYAGLTADGRIVVKGLEVRRGDWCELAKRVQKNVIEIILKDRDPEKAVNYVRKVIEEIKSGKVPIEDYIIYKGLTRKPSKYESMQAHVKAAMKAAKKGIVYTIGSKVGFVVLKGTGNIGDRAFPSDLIEDFDGDSIVDVDGNRYKLDKDYYIDNQVIPVVMRILERFGYSESQIKGREQKTLDAFW
ncbi:DNA-directed DNA polymerase [Archaeoglobus veneficus]|uniref:DNA polymerase n=1 Tax=Archaeoglobus veneficus (strain DSM 11195 / SNP6) TaxID=693661 RepID=F2KPK9_ARCVS|nr:DNA-directed DNA polymerase [Archaeoglobus veneficus]AEA47537.1 DNA polymerase Pol2 [Archaeoglobus veneficus SNP6]